MSAPTPRRRLDEFDPVAITDSDFIVGYRPGAKGIRFPISSLVELINGSPFSSPSISEEDADARYVSFDTADQLFLRKILADAMFLAKEEAAKAYLTKQEAIRTYAVRGDIVLATESGRLFRVVVVDNFNDVGEPDAKLTIVPITS